MTYKNINDNEVLYLVKEGNDCLDIFIDKYRPIILSLANKYYKSNSDYSYDYDDIVQEGILGLCNAVNSYDSNKNILFYTYACVCIERTIYVYVSKRKSKNYFNVSLDGLCDNFPGLYNNIVGGENYTEDNFFDNNFLDCVINFKNDLNFVESCIFEMRCNGFAYREISSLLEISIKYIDNTLQKCRKKFSY